MQSRRAVERQQKVGDDEARHMFGTCVSWYHHPWYTFIPILHVVTPKMHEVI